MKYEYALEPIKNASGKTYVRTRRLRGGKLIHRSQAHPRKSTPINTYRTFVEYIRAGGLIKGLDD